MILGYFKRNKAAIIRGQFTKFEKKKLKEREGEPTTPLTCNLNIHTKIIPNAFMHGV